MAIFIRLLGQNGLIGAIGLVTFLVSFRYAHNIFDWIERQTIGTRTYILEKLEFLFIEVKPERITYMLLALSFGLGGVFLILFGLWGKWILGVFLAMLMTYVGFKIPKFFIDHLVQRRINAYQDQLVDALTLLSNGLRAGLSVPQSLGMVVDEMPNPVAQEFNVILQQNRIGVPLEECFESLAKRIPTEDNDMFVSSVNILRESGGNLAETFDTIVSVIRERIRLQQKVQTYVAQGMVQGMAIFSMPFLITLVYTISDPDSMLRFVSHPIGIIGFIISYSLAFVGGFFILKIVKIKV